MSWQNNLVNTADNSKTLFSQRFKQHYHSINGAVTESMHIYIGLGLQSFTNKKINILEIGYGTGLNALLSYKENLELNNLIFYHGIDIIPVEFAILQELGYGKIIEDCNIELSEFCTNWGVNIKLSDNFILKKQKSDLLDFFTDTVYDLIYFDAFSPEVQPEMWTEKVMEKIASLLNQGGILVTYCSKGIVKQNLRKVGFDVKRYKGPPGKHHVIRATKI
ncbi:MAG TPA: tRNA (5-methylaminomethyl-2-thiouridine)(34)-methyltransferase MnmD [Bacteroidales bacterium]|nr:tRNA (5-methylaminomethyl-2-thiouridine)(34)-methyltransferase MnmD [Bacteroidales bacterium]